MAKIIDPYGSELVQDYVKIIKAFGLDKIFMIVLHRV